MSNGNSSSQTGAIILSIVAGVGVGLGIAKVTGTGGGTATGTVTLTDTCHAKGNHNVQVASDGSLDCPDVVIGGQNSVTWLSSDLKGTLTIHYRTPNIFVEQCKGTGNVCPSGRPTITWATGETQREVDYYGTYDSGPSSKPINGRIIIVKP